MKSNSAAFSLGLCSFLVPVSADMVSGQEPLRAAIDPLKFKAACPDYKTYSMRQQYVRALFLSSVANTKQSPIQ